MHILHRSVCCMQARPTVCVFFVVSSYYKSKLSIPACLYIHFLCLPFVREFFVQEHRRILDMGYKCHIPRVKPLLDQKQRQKHLTWAVEKKNWTVAQWSKVPFSDESKCCISFGNQGPRDWRKSQEVYAQIVRGAQFVK